MCLLSSFPRIVASCPDEWKTSTGTVADALRPNLHLIQFHVVKY